VASYPVKLFAVKSAEIYRLLNDLRIASQVESCYAFGEFLHVTVKNDAGNAAALLREIVTGKGHSDFVLEEITPTIEDSFIRMMNKADAEEMKTAAY